MLACRWDAQSHQVGSGDVGWVLPAPLQELHGLAVSDGARRALLVWLQTLIQQPLGFL